MTRDASHIFEQGLGRGPANFRPLTPLDFLSWAGTTFRDRTGVVYGAERRSWGETLARCRRLASALAKLGVGRGDTVAIMCPNTPPMLEAHYGVPMLGAVLNALNTRLDAAAIAFILQHGEAKVLLTDTEWAPVIRPALEQAGRPITVIDIVDPAGPGERLGLMDYEALLKEGDPAFAWEGPQDEWDAIALCYTSGTTGNPKGVVYHHRGAFLNALGNALVFRLSPDSVYLWTLPMFHCNGWTYTWGVTAVGGTHVCLRKVDPAVVFPLIRQERVTHLCGAPIVMSIILQADPKDRRPIERPVTFLTAAAPPPEAVLGAMKEAGFNVTHLYGLTETYGPAVVNDWHEEWDALDRTAQATKKARQG
ncbi:MAG TPA: AMP-binding protein, partial [Geminicoccaceae bacterium]|nr:AMP-binding protein [Geminicoccaceae bacterium]